MKNSKEASERICELEGRLVAIDAVLMTLLESLPPTVFENLVSGLEARAEAARTVILHTAFSDHVLTALESDIDRIRAILARIAPSDSPEDPRNTAESVLLTTTRISTFIGPRPLSGASGFFFRRDGRLFLVTNRHVFADEPSGHFPDRIEIEVHTDPDDLARFATFSIPLYGTGLGLWRQASDCAGAVDVAAIEIEIGRLPKCSVLHAFDLAHLDPQGENVTIGDVLTVIGFPLGFHDTVHHLAVARSASIASAYGVRFQRQGYFLTDARTHRGSSGAPVLRRRKGPEKDDSLRQWQLLGVHSTRMDMRTRDLAADESLGLNCVWYADILKALTEPRR